MQFASPRGRSTRFIAAASAVLTLGMGLAACGGGDDSGGPSKSEIVKAMKANGGDDTAGMSDSQLDCIAGVLKKYVKGDALQKAVDGGDVSDFDIDSEADAAKVFKNPDDAAKMVKEGEACESK